MNFSKMRAFNTFLFLVIGILIGFLAKAPAQKYRRSPGPAPVSADLQRLNSQSFPTGRGGSPVSAEKPYPAEEPEPPSMEIYALPFEEEESGAGAGHPDGGGKPAASSASAGEGGRKSKEESFFKNPERYINSELELKLQLVNVEKKSDQWHFTMGYTARNNGDTVYIELDADKFPDDPAGLRVGYFYKVRFKFHKGGSSPINSLLSISPAEEAPSSTEEE